VVCGVRRRRLQLGYMHGVGVRKCVVWCVCGPWPVGSGAMWCWCQIAIQGKTLPTNQSKAHGYVFSNKVSEPSDCIESIQESPFTKLGVTNTKN
jgi:hypothetical protein